MLEITPTPGCAPTCVSLADANALAKQAAHAYRWWWVDREQLLQTAWTSMLEAARSGRYRGPSPLPYLAIAAYRGVQRACYQARSPVSGSDGKCVGLIKIDAAHDLIDTANPEHAVSFEEWRAKVRTSVMAEVEDDPELHLGLSVILDGERPAEVAARHGVDSRTVYRTVDRMKRRLAGSRILFRLAQEMG